MIDEISIARKARAAEEEVAELRSANERLAAQVAELLARRPSVEIADRQGRRKCYSCAPVVCDPRTRTIECATCGSTLNAFDVVLSFADKERRFWYTCEEAKRELAKLRVDIDRARRELADAKKGAVDRIVCPRGCGKAVAKSSAHPLGVTPHACYKARADKGLVPPSADQRWRAVVEDGSTRWTNHMAAMRAATDRGGSVEEYTGPIGEAAEREAARATAAAEDASDRARTVTERSRRTTR